MSILELAGNSVKDDILRDAGLNWNVELSHHIHGPTASANGFTDRLRATVRTDNNRILGIVGKDYQIVQNEELVYLAQSVLKTQSGMRISTAGELRNGERVWLAVEAPSREVGNRGGDFVFPYLLITNGHDGLHALGGTPTTMRVVCENTLNMAIRNSRKANTFISIRHKGDMSSKIEGMSNTLSEFFFRTEEFYNQANALASNTLSSDDVSSFFNQVYSSFVEEVPFTVTTKKEIRQENKKISVFRKWYRILERESDLFGLNMWTAFNSVSNWIDHDTSFRGDNKVESRFVSNIFGKNADTKAKVFNYALTGSI